MNLRSKRICFWLSLKILNQYVLHLLLYSTCFLQAQVLKQNIEKHNSKLREEERDEDSNDMEAEVLIAHHATVLSVFDSHL